MVIFFRLVSRISLISGVLAAAMIAISILVVCQMVYLRYVENASTVWQTEFVTYCMLAATLIGMPYVQKLRGHVNVDLLPIYLRGRARFALAIGTYLLSLAVCLLLTFYGFEMWHEAWAGDWTSDTVWAVPLDVPYAALPLGFGLMSLQYIADLLALLTGHAKPFDLPDDALGTAAAAESASRGLPR
ncbi:TRAP transporter small permease [Algihabitans sp.]|uniref:TRAP transporter small permease n=1 Tax=Algihabitans sp. TaxID=2821514 RepID=UPI003BAB1AA8